MTETPTTDVLAAIQALMTHVVDDYRYLDGGARQRSYSLGVMAGLVQAANICSPGQTVVSCPRDWGTDCARLGV